MDSTLYMQRVTAPVAGASTRGAPVQMFRDGERQYPRLCCKAHAVAGVSAGEVRSFSQSGLFLATEDLLSPGAEVELDFHLPDGTPVSAVGEVARVVAGARRGEPGLGIRFLRINTDALSAIGRLVLA